MSGTMPPVFRHQFVDANGDPLDSGTVEWFLAGTDTRESAYSDIALATPIANPYTLPASGKLTFYLSPAKSYKILVKDSDGNTVDTIDNIPAVPESAENQDIQGTAGANLLAWECCYLASDGTWYKADASAAISSITANLVGFATGDIAPAESGLIRIQGRVTGVGLTPGSPYYVSTTPGDITATPPGTNRRFVGLADTATTLVIGGPLEASAPTFDSAAVAAAGRLYLDGRGDTYIHEESGNSLALVVGGGTSLRLGAAGVSTPTAVPVTFGGPIYIAAGAIIRPTTLSADVNDWAPTGFSGALLVVAEVNVSSPGNKNITGLAGGTAGRVVFLVNRRGGGDTITLVANSGSSSAGNKFAGSIVMESGAIAMLIWDAQAVSATGGWYVSRID